MEKQDYATALKELQQIDRFVETDEIVRLRDLAASKQARVKELKTHIDRSVSDKKLHGLLKSVNEYLALKPNDEQMQQLQTRLEARDKKNAAQLESTLQKASGLRDECQFDKAARVLERIPENLITEEASELLEFCEFASGKRADAMNVLKQSQASEDYSGAIKSSKKYFSFLNGELLEDIELERELNTCKHLLKQQEADEEAELQRKAFQSKVIVGTGALIGLALLVAAGLWWRASAQASALAEALQQGQWDAALAIDPDNVQALTGAEREAEAARILAEREAEAARILAEREAEAARILAEREAEVARILAEPSKVNSVGMRFKPLPAGTFSMAHKVTLTNHFELGVYEVTQEEYERVMGTNPSQFKGARNPVEQVSWDDAVEFCRKLSALPAEKSAGYVYRLPTEAEWEYACRAGTTTVYSFGDSAAQLGEYAWYIDNSGNATHPVGGKKPNAWGLYEMHGNVWEWCQDWYGDYPSGAATDPTGPSSGSGRVHRGGSWNGNFERCRSANRFRGTPDYRSYSQGFRVLRSSVK